MQHMQQNDQKMLPKSTQRLPKSTPKRPRCSQDGLSKGISPPKGLPQHPQNTKKLFFFCSFWGPNAPRCPGPSRQRSLEPREPQDLPRPPLHLDSHENSKEFSLNFEGSFIMLCFALKGRAMLRVCRLDRLSRSCTRGAPKSI